jgi:hypothetical protein
MSRTAKPRSDSTLKTLPEVIQEQLYALLRTTSYAKARAIAREKWEIETSTASLCAFFSWYPTSRRLEIAKSTADEVGKTLRALGNVSLDDAQIQRATQAVFEAQALKSGDLDAYMGLAKIQLAREAGRRDERRIALLETRAAQADKAEGITRDETLTPEQRAAKLREIFGLRA